MKNNKLVISKLKRQIMPVLKKNGVARAGLFGSYSRGEQKKGSDIDILVKFKGKKSLFNLAALEIQLEKKLGKRVDILTYGSIHPFLKGRVLKDEVKLL